MSLPAHLEIIGNHQGNIEGSCDMQGRKGTIFVHHIQHSISVPSAITLGGKRVHGPLIITKDVDKASPKLNQALTRGEKLAITLKWYRINPSGHEEHYFTHILENAIIKSLNLDMELEHVAFVYKKIIWRWEPDGIESEDYWKDNDDF